MSRARLRKILTDAGVRLGRKDEGDRATIVEYTDWWGIMPGVPGTGSDTPDILRALNSAGIGYEMRNFPMVARHSA